MSRNVYGESEGCSDSPTLRFSLDRAQEADPEGTRTLCVLTKPDLVTEGGEQRVIQVLSNAKKRLKLGYFMVKNRNQKEVKNCTTLQDARKAEQAYFKESQYGAYNSRLGVPNLTKQLEELLYEKIIAALPGMEKEIHVRLCAQRPYIEMLRTWNSHFFSSLFGFLPAQTREHREGAGRPRTLPSVRGEGTAQGNHQSRQRMEEADVSRNQPDGPWDGHGQGAFH